MRVAVTGLGVMCASGAHPADLHQAMIEGRSAVAPRQDAPELGLQRAVSALCPAQFTIDSLPAHQLLDLDRVTLFSLHAGLQAIQAAEAAAPLARERMPVVWGCSMGGIGTLDEAYIDLLERRKKRARPMTVPMSMPSAPAFFLAHHLQLLGPVSTFTAACASSALAIGQAARMIERGEADAVLCGGGESMVTPAAMRAWQMTGALSPTDPVDASRSCRPFDARRNGFAMGEGAGALVLESVASARRRGAPIHGYVRGFGHTSDIAHISRPSQPSQVAALRAALADAGLAPDQIHYLNAHGTATVLGDLVEAGSIQEAFGACAERLPVSSTKGLHGHTLGGSGAIESIVTLQALQHRLLPPNAHLEAIDPNLPALNFLRQAKPLPGGTTHAVSNSFAFGGVNACLVLESAQ